MATERFICVHGHFYQPPRENPWLERIDLQESAHPYHDWNARIDRECYAPNAAARILDDRNRILRIVCNYDSISFNFGPTLLSWLEVHDPTVYRAILEADWVSAARFGGHGSAIAQAWGHAILPLCNARDKRTQVLWGVRDFQHRFKRPPEGMWLPETAVDTPTLEALAEQGVRFTILAPRQALAVRPHGGGGFTEVAGGIDPRRAYRCPLPSGREIALFFYDGGVSQAVAFERLLSRGDRFAARLLDAFDPRNDGPQLVHIATDGETYGHHHNFGDMALAWALDAVDRHADVRLTNYGEFLERFPPRHDVRIREGSAWSCAHGVGRWAEDCGCSSGAHQEWNQAWRAPLRRALDLVRDACAERFERDTASLLADPWRARDEYVDVLLDGSEPNRWRFLERHAARALDAAACERVWKLLELQRQTLLMYTSCGWFFDDLAGIETIQVLRYAARALELADGLFADGLRERFLAALAAAASNRPAAGNGRRVFDEHAASAAATLPRIAASGAVRLLFAGESAVAAFPALEFNVVDGALRADGVRRLWTGRLALTRRATGESAELAVAAIYAGDHELVVGVRPFRDRAAWQATAHALHEAFDSGNGGAARCVETVRASFREATWSLGGLLVDEQHLALGCILEGTLGELESVYRKLLEHHAPLRRLVTGLGSAQPLELRLPAELVLNEDLRRALEAELADPAELERLVARAAEEGLGFDARSLSLAASDALARAVRHVVASNADTALLERAGRLATAVVRLPFGVDLHASQNAAWQLRESVLPDRRRRAASGDGASEAWLRAFHSLADTLGLRLD